jgi:hypothetical protein
VTDPSPVKIGLWGANASGKTTFLAALLLAIQQSENGSWRVDTDDADSKLFMRDQMAALRRREFPPASQTVTELSWVVDGYPGGSLADQARSILAHGGRRVVVRLDVVDCPGGIYDERSTSSGPLLEQVLDHLDAGHGLLYLFDKTRPLRDSYEFFGGVLNELRARFRAANRLTRNGMLPHSLAVCVTKLDDPRVFELARQAGVVHRDGGPTRVPRVPEEQARRLFQRLAVDGGDDLIVRSIANNFESRRVRYFATSAVGFLVGRRGTVDLHDYTNVNTVNGAGRIRGDVRPINVLEPLLWLEQAIRTQPPVIR